jgi:pimeloyl-ACP methyl ester carboxylesterase
MFLIYALITVLLSSKVINAESLETRKDWPATQRTGFQITTDFKRDFEGLISVPLDPHDQTRRESFDLYYFVNFPDGGPALKTVLFIAGGPGELARPISGRLATFADFLTRYGYNVVYFDLRGTGLSQIPASNEYDKFLRTANAAHDIDMIREELVRKKLVRPDGKWDAIIAWSYGTVLAHNYAARFPNVDRLILMAPISLHKFGQSGEVAHRAYSDYQREVRRIREEVVTKLFENANILVGQLSIAERKMILQNVLARLLTGPNASDERGIFQIVEDEFGNEQFIVDNFCDPAFRPLLKDSGLNFNRDFFEALRKLRNVGWHEGYEHVHITTPMLQKIVKTIAVELTPKLVNKFGSLERDRDDCSTQNSSTAARVLNVLRVYDGLQQRFLNAWLVNGKRNIRDALRTSAGRANLRGINTAVETVGISDDEQIIPWDPGAKGNRHAVPTLILKGSVDPVTADGQAEYYYNSALEGPRVIFEFQGVGHWFGLPSLPINAGEFHGAVRMEPISDRLDGKNWLGGRVGNRKGFGLRELSGNKHAKRNSLQITAIEFQGQNRARVKVVNTSSQLVQFSEWKIPIEDENFSGLLVVAPNSVPANVLNAGKTTKTEMFKWVPARLSKPPLPKFGLIPPFMNANNSKIPRVMSWGEVLIEMRTGDRSEPSRWRIKYHKPPISPCARNVLDCFIYQFIETESYDFIIGKVSILKRLEDTRFFARNRKAVCIPEQYCEPSMSPTNSRSTH